MFKTHSFRTYSLFEIGIFWVIKSLKTIKSDFYVNNKQSRYYSKLIDNIDPNYISTGNTREINPEDYPKDGPMIQIFESLNESTSPPEINYFWSYYYLHFHDSRLKTLSWLPFALFHIGNRFIIDLIRIQNDINQIRISNQESKKIKWLGKRTHIGYILSKLAQEGYIEAPKLKNGEVNYTAFARLIKELFEVDVTEGTLRKYLNPLDDKFEENQNTFEKEQFYLPNVKQVN